ncbi:MAG: hypothetical protein M3O50_19380 [Myxococcota bacterium]|nr:hypothetical protein [Myxococcota bacterium]
MQKLTKMGAIERRRAAIAFATVTGAVGVLSTSPAQAHFYLVSPTSWVTQNAGSGAPQKTAPCGNETANAPDGVPSGVITGLSSNADGTTSVTIAIHEVVAHAGWYRVSLVAGPSSSQTTATLPNPTTPPTTCAAAIELTPTLPVVADNVFRHTAPFTQPQSLQIKLPANVTCTRASPCTLQVLEVMNDGGHAPPNCFYHHCADISISTASDGGGSGAGSSDASAVDDAADASSASGAASGSSGLGGSGMASTSGASSAGSSGGSSGGPGPSSGSALSGGSGTSSGTSVSSGSGGPPSGESGVNADAGVGGGSVAPGGCALSGRRTPTFPLLLGLAAVSTLLGRRRSRR